MKGLLVIQFNARQCLRMSVAACLGALFVPQSGLGQSVRRDSLQYDVTQMETVEVKADKEKLNDRTVTVQTITREEVERQGITDLADALRRMSGTNVRDYGGAGGMKTLSVRSMGATHTAVVYDGIAVTDCESGQIDLSRFSLDQVDCLKLVVGDNADIFVPARALASAATLYLNTGAPKLTARRSSVEARVAVASFGYVNPHVKIEQCLGKNWSMRLQGDFLRADNHYPFTLVNYTIVTEEKRGNNALKNGTAEADVYYTPQSAHRFHAKFYYYDSQKELPGQVVYYNPVNNESQRFRNIFGQAHYETRWAGKLSYQANVKANYSWTRYRDKDLKYENNLKEDFYRQQEYYGSMSLLYSPFAFLCFSVSSDYAYTQLSSDAIDMRRPFRHTVLESLAVKYSHPHLTATATLLASVYKNGTKEGTRAQNAHRFSPSVAVAWHPGRGMFTLRASYKDIIRMPTFNDNYYTKMGNYDLNPEIARQYNVGGTFALVTPRRVLKAADVQADVYYNKVRDKIVSVPLNMFYWSSVNLGKVDVKGTDVKVMAGLKVTKWLEVELNGNYTYQYAVNTTSPGEKYYKDQIAYTPRHSGGGSVALLTPWVNVSFHGTAMSKRYATNENQASTEMDPYHEFGIAAYRDFRWKKVGCSLRADVLNLTDEQYEIVRRYPMPGRSWKITMKLTI